MCFFYRFDFTLNSEKKQFQKNVLVLFSMSVCLHLFLERVITWRHDSRDSGWGLPFFIF